MKSSARPTGARTIAEQFSFPLVTPPIVWKQSEFPWRYRPRPLAESRAGRHRPRRGSGV